MEKIVINSIEKNSKYKIIHYQDKHFIFDLNRNKLTYIIPIVNYVIRQQLIEISEDDLQKIKIFHINKDRRNKALANGRLGVAVGISIGFLARPFIKYIYFEVSLWLNILFILILFFSSLTIKTIVDNKKKHKMKNYMNDSMFKAFILPNTKVLLKIISFNIFLYTLFALCILDNITYGRVSVITILFIMSILLLIFFQNITLYNQTTIQGRIGGIKWKQ
ncbi:DUF443 family protein [Staphylococcus pettenkoferi]|uniref:DUF443 family protein n=1 Tax=Staphylococcus pettenkoferi TaxID=170573 RepID=UPI0009E2BD8C